LISTVQFSADSRILVIADRIVDIAKGGFRVATKTHLLETATGKELPSLSSSSATHTIFDADARFRASYGDDQVQVVELASGRLVATWRAKEPIEPIALSSDARTLLVRNAQTSKIRMINLTTKEEVTIDVSYNDKVTLTRPYWMIINSQLWDTKTGKPVAIGTNLTRGLSGATFSPDGGHLAFMDGAGGIRVWDLLEVRELANFKLVDFPVYRMTLSSGGRVLAIDRNGGAQTKLWDVASNREIRTLRDIGDLHFTANGQLLLSRSYNGDRLQLWQVPTGREIGTLFALPEVAGVRFSPNGETLHGWSKEGDLLVWPTRLSKWREAGCAWITEYLRLHPSENSQTVMTLDGKTASAAVCDMGATPVPSTQQRVQSKYSPK
jgi:WD40 repeat protein